MAQVLAVSSEDTVRTFIYKHLGVISSTLPAPHVIMKEATAEAIRPMLVELLAANKVLRAAAPVKHVFDDAVEIYRRIYRVRHRQWTNELERRWDLVDLFAHSNGETWLYFIDNLHNKSRKSSTVIPAFRINARRVPMDSSLCSG